MVYKSDRYFILYDFSASHSRLVLRSQLNHKEQFNIDIVFYDTMFTQLATQLQGVTISIVAGDQMFDDYTNVKKYLTHPQSHLFKIESQNNEYYIAASFFKVYSNDLEYNETSLNNLNHSSLKEIASSL